MRSVEPGQVAYEAWANEAGDPRDWFSLAESDRSTWRAAELASQAAAGRTVPAEPESGWVSALREQLRDAAADAARAEGNYSHGKRYAFEAALAMLNKLTPLLPAPPEPAR